MIIIGSGIAIFVLPKLASVYTKLKIKLPFITKVLIDAGLILGKYGLIIIPAFLIFVFSGFYLLFFYKKTKFIGQIILLNTPGIKSIVKQTEFSRLGYALGTLIGAGIPIISALDFLEESTDFFAYKKFYNYIKINIDEGNSFKTTFKTYPKVEKLIPIFVIQIIVSGEQSGSLPQAFIKIADTYAKKNETAAKDIATILEPVLLVTVFIGVALLALAVILPVYSLVGDFSSIGNQSSDTSTGSSDTASSSSTPDSSGSSHITTPVITTIEPQSNFVANSNIPFNSSLKSLKVISLNSSTAQVPIKDNPAPTGNIISQANIGEKYNYVETQGNWYKILFTKDSYGWINKNFIKVL